MCAASVSAAGGAGATPRLRRRERRARLLHLGRQPAELDAVRLQRATATWPARAPPPPRPAGRRPHRACARRRHPRRRSAFSSAAAYSCDASRPSAASAASASRGLFPAAAARARAQQELLPAAALVWATASSLAPPMSRGAAARTRRVDALFRVGRWAGVGIGARREHCGRGESSVSVTQFNGEAAGDAAAVKRRRNRRPGPEQAFRGRRLSAYLHDLRAGPTSPASASRPS